MWSAGVTGAPIHGIKVESIIPRANRYKVNEYNRLDGYQYIFAIGDTALKKTTGYQKGHPMVAQPAIQQGEHLAKNLVKINQGQAPTPFVYNDKGSMATIGRNKAVVDIGKLPHIATILI